MIINYIDTIVSINYSLYTIHRSVESNSNTDTAGLQLYTNLQYSIGLHYSTGPYGHGHLALALLTIIIL